jgi:hypothetical protein
MPVRQLLGGMSALVCAALVAAPAALANDFTTLPAVAGEPRVGATLTHTPPQFDSTPSLVRSSWVRCLTPVDFPPTGTTPDGCAVIPDTLDQPTYTLTEADRGHHVGIFYYATWTSGSLTIRVTTAWLGSPVPAAAPAPATTAQPTSEPTVQPTSQPTPQPTAATPVLQTFALPSHARTLRSALAGKVRLGIYCSIRCTLKGTLTVSARLAKRLGLTSRTVGSVQGSGEGRVLLSVRFTKKAARALRTYRRTVSLSAQVSSGATVVEKVTMKLTA